MLIRNLYHVFVGTQERMQLTSEMKFCFVGLSISRVWESQKRYEHRHFLILQLIFLRNHFFLFFQRGHSKQLLNGLLPKESGFSIISKPLLVSQRAIIKVSFVFENRVTTTLRVHQHFSQQLFTCEKFIDKTIIVVVLFIKSWKNAVFQVERWNICRCI